MILSSTCSITAIRIRKNNIGTTKSVFAGFGTRLFLRKLVFTAKIITTSKNMLNKLIKQRHIFPWKKKFLYNSTLSCLSKQKHILSRLTKYKSIICIKMRACDHFFISNSFDRTPYHHTKQKMVFLPFNQRNK